jgi:hypothetical protein
LHDQSEKNFMTDQKAAFAARAAQATIDLHVALEAWFNARCDKDPSLLSRHFDEGFRMVSPLGKTTPMADFARALPNLHGARPGLKMEISAIDVRWASESCAVVAYQEKQTQGETVTVRLSTAVLLAAPGRPDPQWLHLQETWLEQPPA